LAVIQARRAGNVAKAEQAEELLRARKALIDQLDAAVKAIRNADTASVAVRAQAALKHASDAAREVAALQELGQARAILDALFVANATLALQLQIARQEMNEIDAEDGRIEKQVMDIAAATSKADTDVDNFLIGWDQSQPGTKKAIEDEAEAEHKKRIHDPKSFRRDTGVAAQS